MGDRITCAQCQARSKRTGNQCRAPAMKGKLVCKFHGGKSTGPRTQAGLEKCAATRTTHGQETKAVRGAHRAAAKRIKHLEYLARHLGLFGRGCPRPRR
ncbi:HGGxSTG domain-containing protein [Ramlibacter sp. Leaf400]|uniref:HGGxSTG domain-containing protein n=1 Tax=Ramlibacter sp. Leaf400 TaxID=1736365 RepID=UPI003FA6B504